MKKTNLISLVLAILMVLTSFPVLAISVGAEGETQTAAEKVAATLTTDPVDEEACYIVEAYNFGNGNVDSTGKSITDGVTDGYLNVVNDAMKSVYTNASKRQSINGVKGIMIPVDTTGNDLDTKLYFRILMDYKVEHATANANQYDVQLQSAAQNTTTEGFVTNGYLFSDGKWELVSTCDTSSYFLTIPKGKVGCFYVPMSSFSYKGGAGGGATGNNSIPLMEVMDKLPTDYIAKVGFWIGNGNGTKIGSVYFVYEDSVHADADENAASQLLALISAEPKNGAAATLADNALTVTNCNASDMRSTEMNEIWLSTDSAIASKAATGIRFHIDTSALDDGARVNPRIRFNIGKDWGGKGYETFKRTEGTILNKGTADAAIETEVLNSATLAMCQSPDSVLYYYVDGKPVALKLTSDIILKDDRTGADMFSALPENYVGDIYIPFESFDIGVQGQYAHKWVNMTEHSNAITKINKIGISHALTGETSNQTVVYSNFEIVYENTAIDSVSVTLKNDLSLNLYAKINEGATDVSATFKSVNGDVNVTPVKDGELYKFSCDGILPQNMTDTFDITLSATLDGKEVTKTIKGYSIRAYLETLLADPNSKDELKRLAVDMLLYGDAAQKYLNYKTDDLASKNLKNEQLELASPTVKGEDIVAVKAVSGTAAEGYQLNSAALRLETRLSLKLGVTAPDGAVVVAQVEGGDKTTCEIKDGYAIFDNIGAHQLGKKITVTFEKDAIQMGQTYTYSVNDYIKEEIGRQGSTEATQALVKALYNYGVSAAAYNS